MLVFVVYNKRERLLLNVNCCARTILGYVLQKCNFDHEAKLDFVDEDGNLLLISEMDMDKNASHLFAQARQQYFPVLVKIKITEPGVDNKRVIVPLVDDWETLFPQFVVHRKESDRTSGPRHAPAAAEAAATLQGEESAAVGRKSSKSLKERKKVITSSTSMKPKKLNKRRSVRKQ